jgi:SAM-dependent methyltransferase
LTDQRDFWESGGLYRPSHHPVVELFARQRVAYLKRIGALAEVWSLLDVGAGNGFSSMYYPEGVRVIACDYAVAMLSANLAHERVHCLASHLPFRDGAFDAVTCWELLHHLDTPVQAIREMLRVARKRIIIFEPNRMNPGHIYLGLTRDSERHCLRFSPRYLRSLVRQAGGAIIRHERCGLLFPNVTPMPIARWLAHLPYRMPLIATSQLVIAESTACGRAVGPRSL